MSSAVVSWLFDGLRLDFQRDRSHSKRGNDDGDWPACAVGQSPSSLSVPVPDRTVADRDRLWLERLRLDDEQVLQEVLATVMDELLAYARRYTHSADLANDVVQETCITFWNHRHTLSPEPSIRAWLFRVCRNHALKLARRDSRAESTAEAAVVEWYGTSRSNDNAGVFQTEQDELSALIRRVATNLSPRLREVFLLYMEHGLTPMEIATIGGVAVATVYSQLRKALREYSNALREYAR